MSLLTVIEQNFTSQGNISPIIKASRGQLIVFLISLQGVLFYVPHWIWKNWEEGKVRMISDGMRGAMVGVKEERIHRQSRLVQYLVESMHMHNTYAFGYFVCEALNFVNVVSIH